MIEHLQVGLHNIHCQDCEIAVHKIFALFYQLSDLDRDDFDISTALSDVTYYKLQNKTVDIYRNSLKSSISNKIKEIVKNLKKAGFEVLNWELSIDGDVKLSASQEINFAAKKENPIKFLDWYGKYKQRNFDKKHLQSCKKCQADLDDSSTSDQSVKTVVDRQLNEFRVVLFVGGMTCAACVGSVSEAIGTALQQLGLESKSKPNYSVNLLQHSAVVIVPNKQVINTIVNAVYDVGFDCKILEVLPVERSINVKLTAAIAGITCSACANSISSAVQDLPFVYDCNINTVTKTGIFVMDDSDDHITKLKDTIEDCGFDFEVLNTTKINYVSGKKQSRTVNLSLTGMFCHHCPEIVHDYLDGFGEAIVVEDDLTLDYPFIKFTYIPDHQRGLTLRKIIKDLNHIRAVDSGFKIDLDEKGPFDCDLVESVSMDEHLRKLAKKEVWRIITRLVIATTIAIPTFIFGIVFMLLLPLDHHLRMWVEEPIWAGNASRASWILLFLSTPVYFFAADLFHRKAIVEIKSLWLHKNSFKKRLFKFGSMNLLMSLGTTVAYISSIVLLVLSTRQQANTHMGFHTTYFDSVVFLTFFLLIGRLLEGISKKKTADAVSGLSKLKSSEATLVERVKGDEEENYTYDNDQVIDIKYLEVDDYIRISSGESPPIDCVLVENSASFDESALTGESEPVKHSPGHQVFSGTVNVSNNAVVAKVLLPQSDSLIDQILNTVREGQIRKAPIERVADTLTGFFVPVIVLVGILVFIIWLSLSYGGALPDSYLDIDIGGWFMWSLEFAIAVFVIACPCGIGLAAPTALFVGSGLAAKYGILVKGGGAAFQDAAKTKIVCFDKTGTLTYGEMRVTDYSFACEDEQMKPIAMQLARDLEMSSKHPLSQAVKTFVTQFACTNVSIPSVETVPGKGLKGKIVAPESSGAWKKFDSLTAYLGNELLMKDIGVVISEEQKDILEIWKKDRKSVILVALEGSGNSSLLAMLACRDQVRAESKTVISYLQDKLGIECYMITGDNKVTADAIGAELGILAENIVAEVLPDDKQEQVKRIKALDPKNVVAMVGDGINDAPALSSADIGIALSSGADIAVTLSDFILLNKQHPLSTIVTLFDLAKKVFRRVLFNFGWALVYNMIGIPIAAGVIYPYNNSRLSPVWASAAMAASSVSVVLSSLALNWYRPKVKPSKLVEQIKEEPVKQW